MQKSHNYTNSIHCTSIINSNAGKHILNYTKRTITTGPNDSVFCKIHNVETVTAFYQPKKGV